MKKNIILMLIFLMSFFCINVNAKTVVKARINYNNVNLRTGPGTGYDAIRKLAINSQYELADTNKYAKSSGCSSGWYEIYYTSNKKGFACADYIDLVSVNEEDEKTNNTCEEELKAKGFPKDYWNSLCALKEKYPNWTFEADRNGLDWQTTIDKESVDGQNYIQTSQQGYMSTSSASYDYETDKFNVKEGSNWYNAKREVIAYYLDPRNWLTERYIFQFEKLSYDSSYQTSDTVSVITQGRDIASKVSTIMEAAQTYNINALYLAAKIVQETGGKFSGCALSGQSVTVGGVTYSHIYNAYNIGAYGGCAAGLTWAASKTTYLRPWTTIEKAILGGAYFISNDYISVGQDTGYFQKFMTSSYSSKASYSHQYMQNVQAAASEASQTYNGYSEYDMLSNVSYKFVIPVYENMAKEVSAMPNKGNPNNHLKTLSINGSEINSFSHEKFEYTYYTSDATSKVKITAQAINSKANIEGLGDANLNSNETRVVIKVIAENGDAQEYIINIIKTDGKNISVKDLVSSMKIATSDNHMIFSAGYSVANLNDEVKSISANAQAVILNKSTGSLVTGDIITIISGDERLEFNAVVKGDPTGDGNINIQDLLRVQKFILGYSDLSGSFYKAADVNQDGKVDIVDLLKVQKHILGYITIG